MTALTRRQLEQHSAQLEREIFALEEELRWKQGLLKLVRELINAKPE
jgi:hypothetical protein